MKNEISSFTDFISKLDAEILKDDEAVLLTGGFASTAGEDSASNTGCNTDNCSCPVTNNCGGGRN